MPKRSRTETDSTPLPLNKRPRPETNSHPKSTHQKLARLPPTHKIQKRPLLHPAIPSPRTSASTPKVIYISASSPFISILKRVRSLLNHVESRAAGEITISRDGKDLIKKVEKGILNSSSRGLGNGGRNNTTAATRRTEKDRPRDEEVQLRATGRAISKALQVAVKLQEEEGWRVRFETSSVGAVDDVVERSRPKKVRNLKSTTHPHSGDQRDTVNEEIAGGEEAKDVDVEMDGVELPKQVGAVVADSTKIPGQANESKFNDTDINGGEEADAEVDLEESRIRRVSCLIIYVGLK